VPKLSNIFQKHRLVNLVVLSLAAILQPANSAQAQTLSAEQIKPYFKGYTASLVIFDTKTGRLFTYNPANCETRYSPCSTFKIFNSLAGLDTGVLKNENHSFKWNGTKYDRPECNRDQTLQTAVSNSIVWCFQEIASGVGEERMKKFLHACQYGNEDITGGITKFWLGSTLKISAIEQIEFLKKLLNDELPFSKRSMAIVRGLIRLEVSDKGVLYGKTGSDLEKGKGTLGWFVGYVVHPDQIYVFAANTQAEDGASGPHTKEIVKRIFIDNNLL
jgi:bla regulator protein BlaR1